MAVGVFEKSDILIGGGGMQSGTLSVAEVNSDKRFAVFDEELGRDPHAIATIVDLADFWVAQGKSYTTIHSNENDGWFEKNLGPHKGRPTKQETCYE